MNLEWQQSFGVLQGPTPLTKMAWIIILLPTFLPRQITLELLSRLISLNRNYQIKIADTPLLILVKRMLKYTLNYLPIILLIFAATRWRIVIWAVLVL